MTITPEKSIYNIGDTITISSKFSKYVTGYYYNGGMENRVNEFNMTGIYWHPFTDVYKIDTFRGENLPPFTRISPYFEVLIDTSFKYSIINYSNDSEGMYGEYNFMNDSFNLVYKIIPKLKGIFLLKIASDVRAGSIFKQTFPGDCLNISGNRNSFSVYMTVNENRDNNYDLILESQDSIYKYNRQNFQERGCYCFKVIN